METTGSTLYDERPEIVILCSECLTGVQRLRYITYFTWLNEELITVPNFPAWICDRCGRREYDTRAISWLNTLLNPATGRRRGLAPRLEPSLPGQGVQSQVYRRK